MNQRMLGQMLRKSKAALRSNLDGSIVAEEAQRAKAYALWGCSVEQPLGRAPARLSASSAEPARGPVKLTWPIFCDPIWTVDQRDAPPFIPNPRARPRVSFIQLRSRQSRQGAKEITDEAAASGHENPLLPKVIHGPDE